MELVIPHVLGCDLPEIENKEADEGSFSEEQSDDDNDDTNASDSDSDSDSVRMISTDDFYRVQLGRGFQRIRESRTRGRGQFPNVV